MIHANKWKSETNRLDDQETFVPISWKGSKHHFRFFNINLTQSGGRLPNRKCGQCWLVFSIGTVWDKSVPNGQISNQK